jgi:hypothetical protein
LNLSLNNIPKVEGEEKNCNIVIGYGMQYIIVAFHIFLRIRIDCSRVGTFPEVRPQGYGRRSCWVAIRSRRLPSYEGMILRLRKRQLPLLRSGPRVNFPRVVAMQHPQRNLDHATGPHADREASIVPSGSFLSYARLRRGQCSKNGQRQPRGSRKWPIRAPLSFLVH